MKIDVYGIQEKAPVKAPVKIYCDDKELVEVPRGGKVVIDVPEGSFLKFRVKKMEAGCDAIGSSVVLSWNYEANLLLAFATNNPDRTNEWLNAETKKNGLFYFLRFLFGC